MNQFDRLARQRNLRAFSLVMPEQAVTVHCGKRPRQLGESPMKKLAYTLATLTLFAGPAIALPSHSIPAPPVFSETQVIPAQTMGMERRAARREFRHERRAHRHEVRHERRMYRHGM